MDEGYLNISREELDLETTLEVGQTFSWYRLSEGTLYDGEGNKYFTTSNGNVLILWQEDDKLFYKATGGMEEQIEKRFYLNDSLRDIKEGLRGKDEILDKALDSYKGLRLLKDDFFPCLISYLCSPQMRIPRIKKMFNGIAERYGDKINVDGRTFLQFPNVEQLSKASEEDLRDLGIGYRAKYVVRTVKQILDGLVVPEKLFKMDYREAHGEIKKLFGVGNKVADCVLLFGVGKLEAFPVDTWIKKAVKKYYPEKYDKNYLRLGDNFRDYFGEKKVGYAQEYLFHYIRNQESNL